MHETHLAKSVLELVLSKAGGSRVLKVRGSIAETEALSPDSLNFHFRAHAAGTAAECAQLELALVHVGARCRSCGAEYRPDHHLTLCPECDSTDGELLAETGIRIDSIEVE